MAYREGFPLPDVKDLDTREWWSAIRAGKLVIQRCSACGTFRHPPVPVCHRCRSFEYGFAPVSGHGVVYTWTRIAHAPSAALKGQVPYNVLVVELPDAGGVRLTGNLLGSRDETPRIGQAVEVVFEKISDEISLPQWRASGS